MTVAEHLNYVLDIRERALRIASDCEREMTATIHAMDLAEPDPDLEPSLGSSDLQNWAHAGSRDDREQDEDLEPDLGAPENPPSPPSSWETMSRTTDGSQAGWGAGLDLEHSDVTEEGDELDNAESDGSGMGAGTLDDEPSLGASEDIDHRNAWRLVDELDDGEDDEVLTEVLALLVDGAGERIFRHIGCPLKGLAAVAAAVDGDRTRVRSIRLKDFRH